MTDELVLYTHPMSRGRIVRWMLEEVGEPYQTPKSSNSAESMKAPEYLAVNPMGKVPALRHGETIVTEAAAICAYLADVFPEAGLAPPPGSRVRGPYYRWLFFAAGPIEAAITDKALGVEIPPERAGMVGYGSQRARRWPRSKARSTAPNTSPATASPPPTSMSASQIGLGMMFGAIDKRPAFERYWALDRSAAGRDAGARRSTTSWSTEQRKAG